MTRDEQTQVLRQCIQGFLDDVGRATASQIAEGIGTDDTDKVRRHLKHLAETQRIGVERPGREKIYFRNGRLARPDLQQEVKAGPKEFVIRTWTDDINGNSVTITEYSVDPLGERTPERGIRIDVADLGNLAEKLRNIAETLKGSASVPGADIERR